MPIISKPFILLLQNPLYITNTINNFICYNYIPNINIKQLKFFFKRKGSWIIYIRQWPKLMLYKFGYSHHVFYKSNATSGMRLKNHLRHHTLIINIDKQKLNLSKYTIKNLKKYNCYTQRGIKTNHFLLLKRTGKESQYSQLKTKLF